MVKMFYQQRNYFKVTKFLIRLKRFAKYDAKTAFSKTIFLQQNCYNFGNANIS